MGLIRALGLIICILGVISMLFEIVTISAIGINTATLVRFVFWIILIVVGYKLFQKKQ